MIRCKPSKYKHGRIRSLCTNSRCEETPPWHARRAPSPSCRVRGRRAVYSCNAQTRRVTFRDFTRTRRCRASPARRLLSLTRWISKPTKTEKETTSLRVVSRCVVRSRTMTSHELASGVSLSLSLSLSSAIPRRRYFANDIMLVRARHSLLVFPEPSHGCDGIWAYSRHPAYASHERCHARRRCEVRSELTRRKDLRWRGKARCSCVQTQVTRAAADESSR